MTASRVRPSLAAKSSISWTSLASRSHSIYTLPAGISDFGFWDFMVCSPWFEFNPRDEDFHQGETAVLVELAGTGALGTGAHATAQQGDAAFGEQLQVGIPLRKGIVGRELLEAGLAQQAGGFGRAGGF